MKKLDALEITGMRHIHSFRNGYSVSPRLSIKNPEEIILNGRCVYKGGKQILLEVYDTGIIIYQQRGKK